MNSIPCSVRDCCDSCNSLAELLHHLKVAHKMKSFHPVSCRYQSCTRSFSNQRTFMKHFNLMHGKNFTSNANAVTNNENVEVPNIPSPASLLDLAVGDSADVNLVGGASVSKVQGTLQSNYFFPCGSGEEFLEKKFVDFCSSLHSRLTLPFGHAEEIVKSVLDLVGNINCLYGEQLLLHCSEEREKATDILPRLEEKFDWVDRTLNKYRTSYRVKKIFLEEGVFIPPVPITIGMTKVTKRTKKKNEYRRFTVKGTAAFIPLRKVLTKLFEQERVLETVLKYMQELNCRDKVISNFIQGQCWTDMPESDEGITLPLELFNDDLEVGNPLGSHSGKNKINATYFSVPCFLPEVKSSQDYMFLAFLTKSSNLKHFKLKIVFKSLIEELNYLAKTGIIVNLDNKEIRLFFQLSVFCGDNLGLNTLGGFCQNFSTGKYNCRFCLVEREQRKIMTKEKPHLLRTEQNYTEGVNAQDVSKNGIHEECAFNSVENFHIIKNGTVDLFHDVFEGVAVYDLCFILKHYMFVTRSFTVSIFNKRLADFNFGCDTSSKPPPLPMTFNKEKGKLRMSGSETACLLKYLGLLIGDLVPFDDPVWPLYVALRKVLDLILSPSFCKNSYKLLELYIHEHHLLYISLTKKSLTPKFHNLIHYPRLIGHFGPLVHLAVKKYERKHRDMKEVSNSVATRVNIDLTVGIKYQMKLGRDFLLKKFSKQEILHGKNFTHRTYASFFTDIENHTFTTPFPAVLKEKSTIRTNWVQIKGTKYNVGCTLYLEMDEITGFPIFGFVKDIFVTHSQKVYFFLQNFQTLGFSERFYSYRIINANSYSIFSHAQIHDFHPQNAASPAMLPDSNLQYVSLLHNS